MTAMLFGVEMKNGTELVCTSDMEGFDKNKIYLVTLTKQHIALKNNDGYLQLFDTTLFMQARGGGMPFMPLDCIPDKKAVFTAKMTGRLPK